MANYQVLARKYRPKSFREVCGQEAIVTTLKNAIRMGRLAHAYLFCGSRGTGKTTLARVFAKALNCLSPSADGEPCNVCSSCKEITSGSSLDILEIDGASHRGIDDIRQINETVGYASSSGKYKIYIIDEVHMLTKEAFNALLKTLEEPPPKVMFIFATTEPHKVLPTILSRCQRFNLSRIPLELIIDKLKRIAKDQGIEIEEEALRLLAQKADGGLRDAESLFDQIIAFHEGTITLQTVVEVLGLMPRDTFFALDQAGKEGRLSTAFEIAHQIFSQGKDIPQFVDSLTEHFRTLLLIKLTGSSSPLLSLAESDKAQYEASTKLYTQEQCLTVLDFLVEAQQQIRFQASGRLALEAILLKVMRTHQRLPIEFLVRRLTELEQVIQGSIGPSSFSTPPISIPSLPQQPLQTFPPIAKPAPAIGPSSAVVPSTAVSAPVSVGQPTKQTPTQEMTKGSTMEDPSPTFADLGIKAKPKTSSTTPALPPSPKKKQTTLQAQPPQEQAPQPSLSAPAKGAHKQSHYDTILQFAAVELEGTIQKK